MRVRISQRIGLMGLAFFFGLFLVAGCGGGGSGVEPKASDPNVKVPDKKTPSSGGGGNQQGPTTGSQ